MFCWGNATHHELCIEGPDTLDLVSLIFIKLNAATNLILLTIYSVY